MTDWAFPKPTRPEKSRKGLRQTKPLERRARLKAKRWGVSRGPSKTAHARRQRETGFMAFCHSRGCELRLDVDTQRVLGIEHRRCDGRREFAHLSDLKRYDKGDVGACLCWSIHKGIDGKEGGKAPWYVALGRLGQRTFRLRLANRARAAWDALTDAERASWEERSAAQWAALKAQRALERAA